MTARIPRRRLPSSFRQWTALRLSATDASSLFLRSGVRDYLKRLHQWCKSTIRMTACCAAATWFDDSPPPSLPQRAGRLPDRTECTPWVLLVPKQKNVLVFCIACFSASTEVDAFKRKTPQGFPDKPAVRFIGWLEDQTQDYFLGMALDRHELRLMERLRIIASRKCALSIQQTTKNV